MLQRLRESLALILIGLLPFHAFLVTVVTKMVEGPGHAPMGGIAIWKEAMLALILSIAIIEMTISGKRLAARLWKSIDMLDALIISLLVLGVVVSTSYELQATSFIYGIRYDFIPLIAFIILRRVPWSDLFLKRAMQVLLVAGVIVAGYGLISFFLPASFFTWLGYSDLHSLYVPGGPIAPFQQIGGTAIRRIQSVMSGPNQLGLWLLIPLTVILHSTIRFDAEPDARRSSQFAALTVILAALLLTFSRAAWIGAVIIIGISLWPVLQSVSRRARVSLVSCLLCLVVAVVLLFPSIILRVASSRDHLLRPMEAVQTMIAHPLGLGLGTAGPASNRTSDSCVMLEEGSDASWAADRPDLCVFVGDTQVQPTDRACHCPFLPENWYLQIGVEMGWIGMILYIVLVLVVLQRLWKMKNEELRMKNNSIIHFSFFIFLSLSVAALFLHAWEDSAVAYTVWMLIATQLPLFARIVGSPSSQGSGR